MESEASEYVNAGDLTRMPLIEAGNGFTKRKLPSSPGTTLLDSTFVGLEPLDQTAWPFSRSLASSPVQMSTSPDIAKYLEKLQVEKRTKECYLDIWSL